MIECSLRKKTAHYKTTKTECSLRKKTATNKHDDCRKIGGKKIYKI